MKIKDRAISVFVFVAMLGLILDNRASVSGCRKGVELCIRSVIPALFPFIVLSPMLTSTMNFKLPQRLHKALKLPGEADNLLICGCLGGYPIGAQCIAEATQRGQITLHDAKRLMTFCCNCGPGFVFGVCGPFFTAKWAALGLWLCHIAGALAIGWTIPGITVQTAPSPFKKVSFMDAFSKGLKSTAQICGWVVLFRCLLEFFQRWILFRLSIPLQIIITGALELTNGCFSLQQIQNEALRFLICEGLLCFGGLCVAMQTASVTKNIPIEFYLLGKLGQTIISTILAGILWTAVYSNWEFAFGMGVLFLAILVAIKAISKNYSRNFRLVGV